MIELLLTTKVPTISVAWKKQCGALFQKHMKQVQLAVLEWKIELQKEHTYIYI